MRTPMRGTCASSPGVGLPDLLVVTSEDKREYLAEHGIAAAVLPWATTAPRLRPRTRDIDVLFLGMVVPRRRRVLRGLRRKGVEVVNLGWTDPALWGEQRAELLSRVKILLNLSRNPGQFAGTRLTLGMGAGCLVVSRSRSTVRAYLFRASTTSAHRRRVAPDNRVVPRTRRRTRSDRSARP